MSFIDFKKKKIPKPARPGKIARVPVIMQMEALECGAASLDMVLAYYGYYVPLSQLRKECGVSRDGSNLGTLIKVADYYGLKAHVYRMSAEDLKTKAECPCILFWNNNHFVVLDGYKNGRFIVNNPDGGKIGYTEEQFISSYSSICTMFHPTDEFKPGGTNDSVIGYLKKNLVGAFPMIALVLITSILTILIGIIEPMFPRFFLDYLIPGRVSSSWNTVFFFGFILIGAIKIIVLWIRNLYLLKMRGKMAIYSNTKYLWHMLSLPIDFFSQRYPSDIVSRGFSNENISSQIIMTFAPLVLDFASMLFYFVMMVAYSSLLTVIGVISVVMNLFITFYVSNKSANLMRSQLNTEAELSNMETTGVRMIETIKASGFENSFFQKWAGIYANYNYESVGINKVSVVYGAIPGLLTQLVSGLILCISVGLVIKGQWTVGIVSAYAAYLASFTAPSNTLISSVASFRTMSTQIERVKDVMEYEKAQGFMEEVPKSEKPYYKLTGDIEFRNVTFGYNRFSEPLIRNFSIKIKPGDSVAFVGCSGSGKSTIAKLLTNLNIPWEGEILFDGKPVSELDRNVFVSSVSSVCQSISIFPDTIHNNISMWDESIENFSVVMAARNAEIYADIMICENGFETSMLENGKNFSGGQRQRLEIAKALAMEPTILVMDEATSALDAETEYKIVSRIRAEGITTIMVSHRLSTVRDCDCIVVLKDGVVLDKGTHQELMERCSYYAQLITNE